MTFHILPVCEYAALVSAVKSRREEYAEATRRALVDAATELFAQEGYQRTSVEQVARKARVTRGALYHHFDSKRDLFEAVFEEQEAALIDRVTAAVTATDDPWERVLAGLDTFLDACLDPRFRELALRQAPVALGWERWRELDERHAMGLVRDLLQALMESGEIRRFPLDLLAGMMFALLGEAARYIAAADDEERAGQEARSAVLAAVAGLR